MLSQLRNPITGLLLLLSTAAVAQAPPGNPGGMPEGPQGRPLSMGENDSASNPSLQDQINRVTRDVPNRGNSDSAIGQGRSRPAKPNEVMIGGEVRDRKGASVGAIQQVDSDGAVVQTANGKVKVPLEAFGIDKKGLIISITKAEFDKLVATASAAPAG